MKIVMKNVAELRPYKKNPRNNEAAIEPVARSIQEFGWKQPIVVDKDNVIVVGHTRWLAAQRLGLQEAPCIVADDLTDEQIKAYRLADNKTNEFAEWDIDLLNEELADLDIDMSVFGFELDTQEEPTDVMEVDIPEVDDCITKPGDLWILGEHRLLCGDSTDAKTVQRLVAGQDIDLLYTDPPYNVNYIADDGQKIINDNMSEAAFLDFLTSAFQNAYDVMKPGAAFYIWHADGSDNSGLIFRQACADTNLEIHQVLIWVKNSFTFGRQDYKWKHEPVLYGWKEGVKHYFVQEYNHPTVIEDEIDIEKLKKEDLKKLLIDILNDSTATTVFHQNKPLKNDLHPTMKPVVMCADMIRNSTRKNETVLDLFGGSGSTMMACEQLGRKCYMMEYDPHYADVIVKRWENLTGRKAELVGGENG